MIWAVMIVTGLANFAARISVFSGVIGSTLPSWAEKYIGFVPTAVLSAIISAALFTGPEGAQVSFDNPRIVAALVASAVAFATRSVIATLMIGLGVLWWMS